MNISIYKLFFVKSSKDSVVDLNESGPSNEDSDADSIEVVTQRKYLLFTFWYSKTISFLSKAQSQLFQLNNHLSQLM